MKEIIKEIFDLDSNTEDEIKTKCIQNNICTCIYYCEEKAYIDKT